MPKKQTPQQIKEQKIKSQLEKLSTTHPGATAKLTQLQHLQADYEKKLIHCQNRAKTKIWYESLKEIFLTTAQTYINSYA